jgi:surface protein
MAKFTFTNPSGDVAYFFMETVRNNQGYYDESSLKSAKGAYWNFTGSTVDTLISSNYIFGWVVQPGSSSFEYNPTDYIPTGSVYFRGTGNYLVNVTGEVTSSTYNISQLYGQGILNTVPLENVFQATWDTTRTTAGSGTSTQLILPLLPSVSSSLYDFVINWGDNTSSSISSSLQSEVTHSYALSGSYTTKMWGTMRGWRFNGTGDRNKLQSVDKWGGLKFVPNINFAGNFRGCNSASFSNVVGVPDLGYTNTLSGFFAENWNLTTINNLEKWNVLGINNMYATFYDCVNFDQNVGSWNVSNVTNMAYLFGSNNTLRAFPSNRGKFTNGGSPSIGDWNVSRVTDMTSMFFNQALFDQNLGKWDVSNCTSFAAMFGMYLASSTPTQTWTGSFTNGGSPSIGDWNTSRATAFNVMFSNQVNFNQNIGSWDVSKGTTFLGMFGTFNFSSTPSSSYYKFNNGGSNSINNWRPSSATRIDNMFQYVGGFNQPIGDWTVGSVTNFANFMLGKTDTDYSSTNYDALLNGWASRPVVSARSINFGTIKYSAAASASRAILTSAPNSWTIVDGGQLP